MSTVISSILQDRASGRKIRTDMNVDCTPKVWAEWNGVTFAVNRTFNVTSLLDIGVGTSHVIFTALMDGTHADSGVAHSAGSHWGFYAGNGLAANASVIQTSTVSAPSTGADCTHVSSLTVGRLA